MALSLSQRAFAELAKLEARIVKLELARPAIRRPSAELPDPIRWAETVSGHVLDVWQREVMLSNASQELMNCSRQVGKTDIVSLRASYRAKFLRRHVCVLAPSWFQSNKVRMRAQGYLGINQKYITKNAFTMELIEGGVIQALPGDRPDVSVRGEVVDDLIVDEASRVKAGLIVAARPTVATKPDATITYLSTPAGKRGEFYNAWLDDEWVKHSIKATECPRISADFLRRERKRLGDVMYSQEYECQFIADSTAVLDPEAISAMFREARQSDLDWLLQEAPVENWATNGGYHEETQPQQGQ